MANTTTGRPHPLFDPGSMYRLGSELSIWSDGGVSSIRRYYEALRLEALEWQWLITSDENKLKDPALWDWGYDEETNRRIHDSHLRALRMKERILEPVGDVGHAGAEEEFALPAMIEYDLLQVDLGAPAQVTRVPFDMFPGLGRDERRKQPEITKFGVKIPVAGDQDGRDCLVLLLTLGLVERLAGVLDWKGEAPLGPRKGLPRQSVRTQQEVIKMVTRALTPETLEPADDASEVDLWRASRLSLILSCVPGLSGKVAGGMFTIDPFSLSEIPNRKFPQTPGATWLVRCLGDRDT